MDASARASAVPSVQLAESIVLPLYSLDVMAVGRVADDGLSSISVCPLLTGVKLAGPGAKVEGLGAWTGSAAGCLVARRGGAAAPAATAAVCASAFALRAAASARADRTRIRPSCAVVTTSLPSRV